MKATLVLISLVVLVQVFAAAPEPKKVSFVDHCTEKGRMEKEKADKAKVDKDKADKAKKDKADKARIDKEKAEKEKADRDKVDYSEADKQGEKFERESVKKAKTSIAQLGKDLAAPFTNPLLKARAIYTWLHHYVQFDAVPNSTRKSPEEVIIRGIGMSLDYAKLFEEMARGAGLDVMYITGHGKGPGYEDPPPGSPLPPFESNHAWNAVKKLDGGWQLIDPSYGARVVKIPEKKYAQYFQTKHFESTPEVFRLTHYPEKPENQFCSDVISWKDYIWPPPPSTTPPSPPPRKTPAPPATPERPPVSQSFKDMGFDVNELMPNVRTLRAGEQIRFVVKTSCENPPIKKEDRYLLFIEDGGVLTPLTMEVEGRVWSAVTSLDPGDMGIIIVEEVNDQNTKGWTLEEFEARKKEGQGMVTDPLATWTVEEEEEGDSPMQGKQVIHSNDPNIWHLSCVDYTAADAQGAKFPREEFKSIRKLARELTFPFTSPVLKARAIFTWITSNIAYDIRTLSQAIMHKSAEKVVRKGMGSCQGYTELFEKLAQAAGLEVMYIVGAGRGHGTPPKDYNIDHAWNAVKINGRWRPIDCTWGSGRIVKDGIISGSGFNSKYFTSSPEVFRREHFPDLNDQQFCSDVLSYDEWRLQEGGNWVADVSDELGLNLEELKPKLQRIPAGKPVRIEVNCRCGPIKPEDQYLVFVNASNGITPLKVGEDGCLYSAALTPLGGQDVTLAYVTEFGNYSVKGLTMQEFQAPHPGIRQAQEYITRWEVEDPAGAKMATPSPPPPPEIRRTQSRPGEAARFVVTG